MNENRGKGHEEPSMEWLREKLRALPAVPPPESLRTRLIADIPRAVTRGPLARQLPPWPRGIRWGAVAAAILAGSVVAWLVTSWVGQGRPTVDANSHLSRAYAYDYNGLHPPDTNLCDSNGLR